MADSATGPNLPPTDDQLAVAAVTKALLTAVNAADVAGALAAWGADGVLMPPHHPAVHGGPAIGRYFERLFRDSRFEFVFTSSNIEVLGNVAVERVDYSATAWSLQGGPKHRDTGKGVHVYRRQDDGSWRLVLDIWNSDNVAADNPR
jgi:uncharacterized protein (TIGR02246 family)